MPRGSPNIGTLSKSPIITRIRPAITASTWLAILGSLGSDRFMGSLGSDRLGSLGSDRFRIYYFRALGVRPSY